MELILWRHAEAQDGTGMADSDRKLTAVGEKQAEKMGRWLQTRLPRKTRILVSPTRRTRQTADFLDLPYSIERSLAVGADTADLIAAAQWPASDCPVLLVGHQPAIGRLASLLIGGSENDMPLKKCGVFWFSTREREHRMQVVLRAVLYPDLL